MGENKLNDTMMRMKSLNLKDEQQFAEYKDLMKTLPDLMIGAEKSGDIDSCSIENLQIALRACNRMPVVSDRWEEILETIKKNIKQKKHIGEWVRGLAPNRIPEAEIREIIESLGVRYINQYVFPALEAEADKGTYRKLMDWYIAVLDRTESGERQNRIFQRLLFYYMHSTQYISWDRENSEKAKAYLLAMERRGIIPQNPYGGYFGDYDHTKLINSILDETYEEKKITIRCEYAEGLLDRVKEKGLAEDIDLDDEYTYIVETVFRDDDWDDLRNVIFTVYGKLAENRRGDGEFSREDLDLTDRFLKRFCKTAEYFLRNCDGSDSFKKAGTAMIRMLHEGDCWLLRFIELKAGDDEESLENEIDKWIKLVKATENSRCDLTLDCLYCRKIDILQKRDDKEGVKKALEDKIATCDAQATVIPRSFDYGYQLHERAWCSDNAMALIYRYHQDDNKDKIDPLVKDIRDTEEQILEIGGIDERFAIRQADKYIELLHLIGRDKEATWWQKHKEDLIKKVQHYESLSEEMSITVSATDAGFFVEKKNPDEGRQNYDPNTSRGNGAYIHYLYNEDDDTFSRVLGG